MITQEFGPWADALSSVEFECCNTIASNYSLMKRLLKEHGAYKGLIVHLHDKGNWNEVLQLARAFVLDYDPQYAHRHDNGLAAIILAFREIGEHGLAWQVVEMCVPLRRTFHMTQRYIWQLEETRISRLR